MQVADVLEPHHFTPCSRLMHGHSFAHERGLPLLASIWNYCGQPFDACRHFCLHLAAESASTDAHLEPETALGPLQEILRARKLDI